MKYEIPMIQIIWVHEVFEETSTGICDALFLSGFDAEVRKLNRHDSVTYSDDILYVILGLHRFSKVPKNFIAVQAEQIGSKWMTDAYLGNLRRAWCVWDFSPRNCAYFERLGIKAEYVPIRVPMEIFYPSSSSMTCHFSGRPKDIDVLFYGARCPRRAGLERDFGKLCPELKVVFRYYDLFRGEREDLISRSKVVLNIHYYEDASLETHRLEYLCSRGKCVISESSLDSELDSAYSNCTAFVPLSMFVKTAQHYATDESSRASLEKKSQRKSFRSQTDQQVIQLIRRSVGGVNL